MRGTLLGLLLLMIGLSSCGGATEGDKVVLDIDVLPVDSTLWYLFTYGANDITIDTLMVSGSGKVSCDKVVNMDTLDFFLLLDHQGLLELPLFPTRDGDIVAKIGAKGVSLEGIREPDSIASWYQAKQMGIGGLHQFMSHYQSSPIAFVMAVDALRRDVEGECSDELLAIQSTLANQHSELAKVLGISLIVQHQQPHKTIVPYAYRVSGEKELKNYHDLMGDRELMVINVMELTPEDSVNYKQQKEYLDQLSELNILSYNVLLNDQLPKGLARKHRHFLVDSVGYSVEFIRDYSINNVPSYMLVDSLRQVWRTYSDSDSVVQFIKSYRKDVGNRVD